MLTTEGRFIKLGPHRCDPPYGFDIAPGDIWECGHCQRRWKYRAPGNPAYEGWYQTWPTRLGLHRIRRATSDEETG